MLVIATARGYDGFSTREEGEEFEMPFGAKGSWFQPVNEKVEEDEPKPKGKHKKQDTDHDLA